VTHQTITSSRPAPAELPALPSSSSFTAFVLQQIGCAKLRAEITVNQCDVAITALNAGTITAEQAILILAECRLEIGAEYD
jgi:hypothetical protein